MNQEFIKRFISSILLIPIVIFFVIKGSYVFNFFILICFAITSYEWFTMTKNKPYIFLGFIFIIFSFYTVYYLRNEFYDNYIYFLMILFICIFTDIGGYVFGKIFKGPKLTKISPNIAWPRATASRPSTAPADRSASGSAATTRPTWSTGSSPAAGRRRS